MNKALRNPVVFFLFVLPALILFTMFFIYPIFSSIYYSFTSWNGVSETVKSAGLSNYEKALGDERFWISVKNNGWFILFSVCIQVPLIVFFSLLISNVKKLKGLYKTAVFMPSIMSTAVIGILWGLSMSPTLDFLISSLV